jgi:hypothetical protein
MEDRGLSSKIVNKYCMLEVNLCYDFDEMTFICRES